MFGLFGLIGMLSQVNGSSFNNRTLNQDRAYRQVTQFQNDVRKLRAMRGKRQSLPQARANFRAARSTLKVFLILGILFVISEWVILPHLHG